MEPDAPHGADGVFFPWQWDISSWFLLIDGVLQDSFPDDHHPSSDEVRDGPGRGQPLLRHGLYAE